MQKQEEFPENVLRLQVSTCQQIHISLYCIFRFTYLLSEWCNSRDASLGRGGRTGGSWVYGSSRLIDHDAEENQQSQDLPEAPPTQVPDYDGVNTAEENRQSQDPPEAPPTQVPDHDGDYESESPTLHLNDSSYSNDTSCSNDSS